MSHYFFDVHDGIHVIDEVGQDLPDLEAAKGEAMKVASRFAARPGMLSDNGGALIIVVRDAPDATVMTVRLAFNISFPGTSSQ